MAQGVSANGGELLGYHVEETVKVAIQEIIAKVVVLCGDSALA